MIVARPSVVVKAVVPEEVKKGHVITFVVVRGAAESLAYTFNDLFVRSMV